MRRRTAKTPKLSGIPMTKIPKRKIDAINRRIDEHIRQMEEEQKRREKEKYKPKKEKIGECNCGGSIILSTKFTSEYDPSTGPPIIGLGSRGQYGMVEHRECYCEGCGILYNPEVLKKLNSLLQK